MRPSACAASSKTGSLSSVSAWSGELETSRRATQTSPLGRVEGREHRVGRGAFAEGVETPAVASPPGLAFHARPPYAPSVVTPGGCGGKTLGPPIFSAEQAADPQRGIPDHLRLHPDARAAGEQSILRVLRQQLGRHPRRLPIRRTRDDQPVHRLDRPALIDQPDRQPIEQLRDESAARPGIRNPPPSAPGPCRRRRPSAGSLSRGRSSGSRATPASGPGPAGSRATPWATAAETRACPARRARWAGGIHRDCGRRSDEDCPPDVPS